MAVAAVQLAVASGFVAATVQAVGAWAVGAWPATVLSNGNETSCQGFVVPEPKLADRRLTVEVGKFGGPNGFISLASATIRSACKVLTNVKVLVDANNRFYVFWKGLCKGSAENAPWLQQSFACSSDNGVTSLTPIK